MKKMFKFKYLLFLVLFLLVSTTSCKKEVFEPNNDEAPLIEEIRIYGKWLLIDGYSYVENLTTNQRIRYNHFDENKTISGLRFGYANIPFEVIEQNVTTWSFFEPPSVPGYGEFVLNDSINTPMGFYVTKNSWRIIEHPVTGVSNPQLGGVARPMSATIESYNDSIVKFYVQEGYTNLNGHNVKYINELFFVKIEGW